MSEAAHPSLPIAPSLILGARLRGSGRLLDSAGSYAAGLRGALSGLAGSSKAIPKVFLFGSRPLWRLTEALPKVPLVRLYTTGGSTGTRTRG